MCVKLITGTCTLHLYGNERNPDRTNTSCYSSGIELENYVKPVGPRLSIVLSMEKGSTNIFLGRSIRSNHGYNFIH